MNLYYSFSEDYEFCIIEMSEIIKRYIIMQSKKCPE
jgi:hypothetical protein